MKINLELDLNEILNDAACEEISANEAIKHEILHQVSSKLLSKNESDIIKEVAEMKAKSEQQFVRKASEAIDKQVDKLAKSLLSEKLTITDKWGKPELEDISLKDLIRKRLHEYE